MRAVVALADKPEAVGEIYNVGSQEEITMRALAERVLAHTGSPSAHHPSDACAVCRPVSSEPDTPVGKLVQTPATAG